MTFNDFFTKNLGYDLNRNTRFKSLKNTSTAVASASIDKPSKNIIRKRSLSPISISKNKQNLTNKSTQTNIGKQNSSAKIHKSFSTSLSSSSSSTTSDSSQSPQSVSCSSSSSSSPLCKNLKNSNQKSVDILHENNVNIPLPNKLIINHDSNTFIVNNNNNNNGNINFSNIYPKHSLASNKSNSFKNKPPLNNDINKNNIVKNALNDMLLDNNEIKTNNQTCSIKRNQELSKKEKLEQSNRDIVTPNKTTKKIMQSKNFNSFRVINNHKNIKEIRTEDMNSKNINSILIRLSIKFRIYSLIHL